MSTSNYSNDDHVDYDGERLLFHGMCYYRLVRGEMKWSAPGSWSGTVGPLRWLESCLAEYSCQWNVGCRPQHRFATRGQCLLGSVGGVWHMAGSANRPYLVGLQITVTVVIGLFHCALCLRLVADKRHFQLHWDNLRPFGSGVGALGEIYHRSLG